MKKSISALPKKTRGRPATGRDPVSAIRLSDEFRAQIDRWAVKQADKPGRSEAIRRLVEIGLAAGKPIARTPSKTAARAAELAAKVIDKHIDPAAPAEERATRKRRILKGPSMARGIRKD